MKPLCYKNKLPPIVKKSVYFIIIATLLGMTGLFCLSDKDTLLPSTLFYYGQHIPVEQAGVFQRVIVEPDNTTQAEIKSLKSKGATVYAYLSIGEVGPYRPWIDMLDKRWVLGKNEHWNSTVMDLSHTGWRGFVINHLAAGLWKKGYQGFFLDTMDSYQHFTPTAEEKLAQQRGIIQLVKTLSQKFSGVSFLFNRGFEVIDEVAYLADGVVAESLFSKWDAESGRYRDVSESDRQWLLKKLTTIRDKHQLPITVLDYLPRTEKVRATDIAHKIQALGFVPWVSTVELDQIGVGVSR